MNILLISLDTLRADRLSCYGHERLTSPHIDRFAAQGALFERFYSPHIPTYPGHTTMMTGRDVYAHRVTGQSHILDLSPEIPMLAEILAARGWYTAAADNLGRWFTRGMAHIEPYSWDAADPSGLHRAEAVLGASLKALDLAASQDRSFFLFLHFWDPHTPYLPPAPFSRMFYRGDERDPAHHTMEPVWAFENFRWYFHEWMPGVTDIEFPKAQYDAEIAYADACLAHVFTRLDELGLSGETLVALTTDHGEELDEHGCWFDHHGLYEPNVHIPFIVRWPGHIAPAQRPAGLARTLDIAPTLLDFAGALDPALTFEGRSLRPMLASPGDRAPQPAGVTAEVHLTENTWMKKRAIRTADWKLIIALEPDIHDFPSVELYHLREDPGERCNLALEMPEKVAELRARMEAHLKRRTAETGQPDPLPLHPIPLRQIGKPPAEAAAPAAPAPAATADAGDFVGYEREE